MDHEYVGAVQRCCCLLFFFFGRLKCADVVSLYVNILPEFHMYIHIEHIEMLTNAHGINTLSDESKSQQQQ